MTSLGSLTWLAMASTLLLSGEAKAEALEQQASPQAPPPPRGGASSSGRPNFVILFLDDWGYGDLGANWPAAEGMTPNMDRLAAEGIRFTDFHVGSSVCSVSRAALLTGRLGLRTGVVHNFAVDSMFGLPRTENTIAELLKPAGYRTAACGKWHVGTTPGYHPSYRGFDHYIGLPYSVDMGCTDDHAAHDKPGAKICSPETPPTKQSWKLPVPLYRSTGPNCSGHGAATGSCNADIVQAPVNFSTLEDQYRQFATDFILGKLDHKQQQQQKQQQQHHQRGLGEQPRSAQSDGGDDPFFLYVPFSHVHTPQYAAPRNVGRSNRTGDAGFFYDSLLEVDDTVGAIMDALKTAGVENDTLVFLTGDNGPWEVKCNLTGSPGPFTGLWQKQHGGGGSSSKTTLWEGGHRMVGVARWPGHVLPRVSNATVSTLDFLPTMLSLAGVDAPNDRVYDGIDISHVLLDGSEDGHETLFHPNSGASGPFGQLDAVRWKHWKAIYQSGGAPDCEGNTGTVQRHDPPLLFDLSTDPAESIALDVTKAPYDGVVATIANLLEEQMKSINNTMRSTVDYSEQVSSEPCANLAKGSCRTTSP